MTGTMTHRGPVDRGFHEAPGIALAEGAYADAQPPAALALTRADAHLLLRAAAFARGLEQAVDGFRNRGISHEHALETPLRLTLRSRHRRRRARSGIDVASAELHA